MSTLFYSWQSDTSSKTNRNFIKDIIEKALKNVSKALELEEAIRLDQDTQGVPGTPEIANTILRKIDECDIFLCDLTIVARTTDGQQVPNPNVLIELGYAIKAIGAARIIAVMNEAYGTAADGLPFDLQHRRWPIRYSISTEASAGNRNEQRNSLIVRLVEAITSICENKAFLSAADVTPPAFPAAEPKDGKARFRSPGEPLGMHWDSFPFMEGGANDVFLSNGPAMWLRLIPTIDPAKKWSAEKLKECAFAGGTFNLEPLYGRNPSCLLAEDGFGLYAPTKSGASETSSVAFVFETGEIWSVDTTLLAFAPDRLMYVEIERRYTTCLEGYSRFFQSLGVTPPYRWICGFEGVKKRRLAAPPPPNHINIGPGPLCLADVITAEGTYDIKETPTAALLPFFELIFQKCAKSRPDYLNR
jgi:hypothetical protein